MTLSDRIRKAALGPTPYDYNWRSTWPEYWLDDIYWFWIDHSMSKLDRQEFHNASDSERRMFFLFVAETLEE